MSYEDYKASVPLAVTVPHYNAVEFLSASSHLTESGYLSDRLQLHDLLSKYYCMMVIVVDVLYIYV